MFAPVQRVVVLLLYGTTSSWTAMLRLDVGTDELSTPIYYHVVGCASLLTQYTSRVDSPAPQLHIASEVRYNGAFTGVWPSTLCSVKGVKNERPSLISTGKGYIVAGKIRECPEY